MRTCKIKVIFMLSNNSTFKNRNTFLEFESIGDKGTNPPNINEYFRKCSTKLNN